MFQETNESQWAWYQAQIVEDKKEQHEFMRDLAEYNAMFFNPEAVQEVREARKNTYKVPDEDFGHMVKEMFGRGLPDEQDGYAIDSAELKDKMKFDPYLNMDLDEIKFTPM